MPRPRSKRGVNSIDAISAENARTAHNFDAASEIEARIKKSRDSLNDFFRIHYALGDYQKNPVTLVSMAVDTQNGFGGIVRINTLCAIHDSGSATILQMTQRE